MKKQKWMISIIIMVVQCVVGTAYSAYALSGADVMFVVDESGSMGGEHAWLTNMVLTMETELAAKGVTDNRYGLIGYGASGTESTGHKRLVGAGDWGTASELSQATASLRTDGSREDGWEAIHFGLQEYDFRAEAALNVILITDEDRSDCDGTLNVTSQQIFQELTQQQAMLNVVVNAVFTSDNADSLTNVLGIDSSANAYLYEGSSQYTSDSNGTVVSAYGNTETAYIDLALATGGAAWNLKTLRQGGMIADAFTASFVDVKVREITQQINDPAPPVPEPATMTMLGLGLIVLIGYANPLRANKGKKR